MKHFIANCPSFTVQRLPLIALMFLFMTCQEEQTVKLNNGEPFISQLLPAQGRVGNKVNITGGNFSKNPQENEVFFNGVKAEVYVGIDEEMIVKVPKGATTGVMKVLVPGYDTVRGPVFTIEKFLKPVLHWHNGYSFSKATFNDEGQPTTQAIFVSEESQYKGFEYDAASNALFLVGRVADNTPLIQKIALDAPTPQVKTLYDMSDHVLQEIEIVIPNVGSIPSALNRIVLNVEKGLFYASSTNGQIIKGNMDGSIPLQKIYDDNIINNTGEVAGAESSVGITLTVGKDHLYWIKIVFDGMLGRRASIMRTSLATNITNELYPITSGLQNAVDLVIDETRNRLYVTDDPNPVDGVNMDCIWQGALDGSLPLTKIFAGDGEVSTPVAGLALDIENNQLYWRNQERDAEKTNNLVRADLDEENPRVDVLISTIPGITGSIEYFTLSFEEDNSGGRKSSRASVGRSNGRSFYK